MVGKVGTKLLDCVVLCTFFGSTLGLSLSAYQVLL